MGKFGFSFTIKRAIGITSLKHSIARSTGIPMTESGLERKVDRTVIKSTSYLFIGKQGRVCANGTKKYCQNDTELK